MAQSAAQTTLINSSLALAQQVQLVGRDIYNNGTTLIGQINSLSASITAGTSFAVAPDLDAAAAKLKTLLTDAQVLAAKVAQLKQDLVIPT